MRSSKYSHLRLSVPKPSGSPRFGSIFVVASTGAGRSHTLISEIPVIEGYGCRPLSISTFIPRTLFNPGWRDILVGSDGLAEVLPTRPDSTVLPSSRVNVR